MPFFLFIFREKNMYALLKLFFRIFPQLWHWITMIFFIVLGKDLLKQEKLAYMDKLNSDLTERVYLKQKRRLFWGRILFWTGIFFLILFSIYEFFLF